MPTPNRPATTIAPPPQQALSSKLRPRMQRGTRKISLRTLLELVLLGAGFCVVVAGLRAASTVLAPVVGALFLALIFAAPIPWLSTHMPRKLAVGVVALTGIAAGAALIYQVPWWWETLSELLQAHEGEVERVSQVVAAVALEYGLVSDAVFEAGHVPREWMFGASRLAFSLSMGLITALVFTGFIVAELAGVEGKLQSAFEREPARMAVMRRAFGKLSTYFRIKTLTSAATGVVLGLGCWALDVPTPALWGLLAFALNFVPNIGSLAAAVPPTLLALVTGGWSHALLVGLLFTVVNTVVGALVEPKIMGDQMGLSPLVILLSLVFWGWVWGPAGLLLAVPMTMAAKIVIEQTEGLRPLTVLLSPAGRQSTLVVGSVATEHVSPP